MNSLKGKLVRTTRAPFPLDDPPFRGFARSRGTLSRAYRKFPPSNSRRASGRHGHNIFPAIKHNESRVSRRAGLLRCASARYPRCERDLRQGNILRDDNREDGTVDTSTRYFRVAPGNSWQRTELRTTYGLVHKTSTLLRRYSISRYF